MKQLIQWQNISTANLPTTRNFWRAGAYLFLLLALFQAGCATKGGASMGGASDRGPSVPQSSTGSLDSFTQGLNYIREHPSAREEDRIQRYLWLDQWIKVLQEKQRLTPEMAQEYWADLVSFVRDEPALNMKNLDYILARTQTKLGKNVVLYYSYQSLMKDQSLEASFKYLEGIEEDGISDLYPKAQELLELNRAKALSVARRIGVLLPLSGDLQGFGKEVLQSIEIVSHSAYADGIEFVIQDTGSTPESLQRAWQKLALEEKVIAIIGPLTAKDSEIIFERAQALNMPVISLAPKENMQNMGSYGFQSTLTIDDQVKTLASFLENDMRAKRVAVLMPDSTYGWDVLERASKEFQNKGLEISEMQVYAAGSTDFKEQLRRMARLDFPKLRKDEFCPKDKTAVAFEGCAKKAADLKPLYNFEVLFVPDFAETVGYVLPTLPYLQMYGVQVVGLSGLNSKKLVERGGDSAEGVIFTDGYLPTAKNFPTQFFREEYTKASSKEPTRLAAEAFDVAMLSVEIMKRGEGPISREVFVDRLKNTHEFPGITGKLYYEDQKLKKSPRLIVVRDGEFQELRNH
jgi:ABC-type branched-subunit amino acid transport system substrate-binding protein